MANTKVKAKPIDFDSETFTQMKTDMTGELNQLLRQMERHGSDDGVMTVKVIVSTEEKKMDDGLKHTVPTFEHKIKTGFTVSQTKEGKLAGDYILKKNDNNTYQLELLSEQLDLLEEEVE